MPEVGAHPTVRKEVSLSGFVQGQSHMLRFYPGIQQRCHVILLQPGQSVHKAFLKSCSPEEIEEQVS